MPSALIARRTETGAARCATRLVQTALVQDERAQSSPTRGSRDWRRRSAAHNSKADFRQRARRRPWQARPARLGTISAITSAIVHPQQLQPYRRQSEYPPQHAALSHGSRSGTVAWARPLVRADRFLARPPATAAGVIGGGLLLNSIRSMFGEHAGLGGHGARRAREFRRAAPPITIWRSKIADQDQDQDQDDDDQALADQDQDQDQDQDDGDFGGDETDA